MANRWKKKTVAQKIATLEKLVRDNKEYNQITKIDILKEGKYE